MIGHIVQNSPVELISTLQLLCSTLTAWWCIFILYTWMESSIAHWVICLNLEHNTVTLADWLMVTRCARSHH